MSLVDVILKLYFEDNQVAKKIITHVKQYKKPAFLN